MSEPGVGPRGKFVIAGNYSQFVNWLAQQSFSGRHVVYISGPEKLAGLDMFPEDVERVGTYYLREDWPEIEEEIEFRCLLTDRKESKL